MFWHTLTENDRWFIDKGWVDSMSRTPFDIGHTVVVCNHKHVMLKDYYDGNCPECGSTETVHFSQASVLANSITMETPPRSVPPKRFNWKYGIAIAAAFIIIIIIAAINLASQPTKPIVTTTKSIPITSSSSAYIPQWTTEPTTIYYEVITYPDEITYQSHFSKEKESVGAWSTNTFVFDEPIEDCTGFTLEYEVTEVSKGSLDGVQLCIWVYTDTGNGYSWESIGSFDPDDGSIWNVNFYELETGYSAAMLSKVAVVPDEDDSRSDLSWSFEMDITDITTE